MRAQSASGPPWTMRTATLVVLLATGTAAALPWTVHPVLLLNIDSSIYIQTSYALLEGRGYTYLDEPFTLRPPGFPALLVPVLAGFGADALAINTFVSLFGILCVVFLFLYARSTTGDLPALGAALALWLNPLFQRLCNSPMSDVPGAALLLGALLAERWARRGRQGRDVVVGVLLAAAVYVRTVAVFLLPAILLSRVLENPGDVASGAAAA